MSLQYKMTYNWKSCKIQNLSEEEYLGKSKVHREEKQGFKRNLKPLSPAVTANIKCNPTDIQININPHTKDIQPDTSCQAVNNNNKNITRQERTLSKETKQELEPDLIMTQIL